MLYRVDSDAMKSEPYQVQVTEPDGTTSQAFYYARGATNAWYIAKELNPGCQIKMLGLVPEWSETIEENVE